MLSKTYNYVHLLLSSWNKQMSGSNFLLHSWLHHVSTIDITGKHISIESIKSYSDYIVLFLLPNTEKGFFLNYTGLIRFS